MYERILIPLDGSEIGESALPYVEDLLSKLSPKVQVVVTLLQVLHPVLPYVIGGEVFADIAYTEKEMEVAKKKAIAYLNKAGENLRSKGTTMNCKVIVSRPGYSFADEIIKAEEDNNPDLIAMSSHGRHGLSRWVFGSVTEKVLRAGKVPVLVVRAGKKT